ncbi:MAG TPA: class III extradiol dioxygenase family protein [Rhizomicrobium sp.]|nr:class III extradiol dioxygenase family protein [Rhizomicrobium sp.]
MATIVGGLGLSHVPAIGGAIKRHAEHDPYWRPFFDGLPPIRRWLADTRPSVVVMFYNDHGLNFFLDKMPTFAIGAAPEYRNADEGWGLPVQRPFRGNPELSWHVIEHLVAQEFDITMCQEMLVDHAFTVPMQLLWPGIAEWPVAVVPIAINTVQHPLPSPGRCYKLGRAVGEALAQWTGKERVAIVGTGGLSHQLDGKRAGFINKEFDLYCLDALTNDIQALTQLTIPELVELSGTQGVELLNWIAMRGALPATVEKSHVSYHIPISNTAAASLLLTEPAAKSREQAA